MKYRSYFYDWDRGHRYIFNLRAGEIFTRHYHSLGKSPEYYVPNGGKDPEAPNERYHIRGNAVRAFKPSLQAQSLQSSAHSISNVIALKDGGVYYTVSHGPAAELRALFLEAGFSTLRFYVNRLRIPYPLARVLDDPFRLAAIK